jgi:hypothetical protein
MEPQPRPLRLVSPFMHGPDVAEAQRLLGVQADGEFGPITSGAVSTWKRSRGDATPDGELSPADRRRLLADVPLRAVRLMERWAASSVREDPPRSNRVPALIALAEREEVAPAYRGMGYPWCAFAAFLAALVVDGQTAALGLRERRFNPLYTPAILAEAEPATSACGPLPRPRRSAAISSCSTGTSRRATRPTTSAALSRCRPTGVSTRWTATREWAAWSSLGTARSARCGRSPGIRRRRHSIGAQRD